jgi:hypothetical protein
MARDALLINNKKEQVCIRIVIIQKTFLSGVILQWPTDTVDNYEESDQLQIYEYKKNWKLFLGTN